MWWHSNLLFPFIHLLMNLLNECWGHKPPIEIHGSTIIIVEDAKACFRRLLAGKRVASHWVRRSLACERVEDCMRECGREKRFTCEGFNYRLDPSGHGQGDCELIEIPFSQLDLYVSANRRDANLLRHPDYDYYERDRNTPNGCGHQTTCKECKPAGSRWSNKTNRPPGGQHLAGGDPFSSRPSGPGSLEQYHGGHGLTGPGRPHLSTLPLPQPVPPSLISPDGHHRPVEHSYEHYGNSGSYELSGHGGYYSDYHMPGNLYTGSGSGSGSGSGVWSSSGSGASGTGASGFGGVSGIDRYDIADRYHSGSKYRWKAIPSSTGYDATIYPVDRYRPAYHPGPDYSPYRSNSYDSRSPATTSGSYGDYYDHHYHRPVGSLSFKSNEPKYPVQSHTSGASSGWGSYGGRYGTGSGGSNYYKYYDQWSRRDPYQRHKQPADFNYFNLGGGGGGIGGTSGGGGSYIGGKHKDANTYAGHLSHAYPVGYYDKYDKQRERLNYKYQWTRRPGPDECSAKTSEGFRLNKKVVKSVYSVPTLTECERLCSGQDAFVCHTYSYRYAPNSRDNCQLCDKPLNRLDYYVDIEPDRDYDIYTMSDDLLACRPLSPQRRIGGRVIGKGLSDSDLGTALTDPRSAQCFFRALDGTRFYKSIVRDSLTVRNVGQCEMECIKSAKFTCRAFAYRYTQYKQRPSGIIDNCQLSDWPVRDMDRERHLIADNSFDIFERASYGHGCEILPPFLGGKQQQSKKLCYLGYGSPAKLLTSAIKKVITVPTELECKKECIRFRETTPFKCFSFSFGASKSTFNCEMSDLDQSELKFNIHYVHTDDRDFWLFAWNPFDYTCRDKIATTGGGSKYNNNRRMDVFKTNGALSGRQYSVSGKACRYNSPCAKNRLTGFYSCELEAGDIDAWDYCCKIDHPCGYSQGFEYPWCFVGDEPDQWRKCSDRYYPGNNTLALQPEQPLAVFRSSDKTKSNSGQLDATASAEYPNPTRSNTRSESLSDFTAARLWPVTYLYSEGPPNSTIFSNYVDCNKETC